MKKDSDLFASYIVAILRISILYTLHSDILLLLIFAFLMFFISQKFTNKASLLLLKLLLSVK